MTFLLESSVHKWGWCSYPAFTARRICGEWDPIRMVILKSSKGNIRGVETNHNGLCLVLDISEIGCIHNR
jgi:hypothetical protein